MAMAYDATLLEAVRGIAPIIRAHSDEAEQQGRLSRPTVDAMLDIGLLRMLTAELAYSVVGIDGIYTRAALERRFRDVEVLKQHAFTSESRYETVGQVYLGLQPDFPLLMI